MKLIDYPELIKEWDYEKNGELKPDSFLCGSNKTIWWKCASCGNEWRAPISRRTAGSKCSICAKTIAAKKRSTSDYKDSIAFNFPDLLKEWNYIKNDLDPTKTYCSSNKKVWWICHKGHEWQAGINARTGKSHSGCPVCSNRIVMKGFNDLATNHPKLIKEWDYEKNGDVMPEEISATSAEKAWWICDKGHSFQQKIYDRTKKNASCPYCQNFAFKPEYNSLEVKNPELAKEWDYEKNYPLTPKDVLYGGYKEYWWKCKNEPHSFLQKINNRKKGAQCPYCSSQKLLSGFNDLKTKKPEILELWNFEKNKNIKPEDVMEHSNKKVWWKCPDCANEWETAVCLVSDGTRCPKCSDAYKVSESEQIIYYYLAKYFDDVELTYRSKWLGRREIDIFIPSLSLAIEYDGEFWHKDKKERDMKKSSIIFKQGISLIRLREEKLEQIDDESYVISVSTSKYNYDRLQKPIMEIFDWINKNRNINIAPDIDVNRDWKNILAYSKRVKKNRSIIKTHPNIAKLWNYDKNGGLKPEQVFAGSNKKLWWKCSECNYQWEAIVVNITKRNSKCPACVAKENLELKKLFKTDKITFEDNTIQFISKGLIQGLNDLKTMYPEVANEWNYEKNGIWIPENFSYGSSRNVWWKCNKCKHEWKTSIANRTYGFGCPKCSRKQTGKSLTKRNFKQGVNDLLTVNPVVASQWNYEKNGNLKPEDINAGSYKKVWWRCNECNNEWQATITSRKTNKACPFCTNRRFNEGTNDIFARVPLLKEEWDFDKNVNMDPNKTICSSPKKVWWKCSKCNHNWKTTIRSRYRGSGCPICNHNEGKITRNKNKINKGNCLSIIHPEIIKEWNYDKNAGLNPDDFTAHSGVKVWWKCQDCGNEWQATIHHKTSNRPTGCPKCSVNKSRSSKMKKVRNINTGEIFDSISIASEKSSISMVMISRVCKGKQESVKGIKWEFV